MANILDYLDWRGDLSFDESPFNEVDNYILCKIGCPDYTGIVPDDGYAPIDYAITRAFADNEQNLGRLAGPLLPEVLKRLPETPRYSALMLGFFTLTESEEKSEQFSALTVRLPDGTRYVSFRGTDDTLIGWKENFLMGSRETVHAQCDALAYLKQQAEYPGKMIVGGHSKGGNLAVFAAANCGSEIQDRITAVYNNDGPGFYRDLYSEESFLRIRDKVHTILSEHAIVGLLLNYDKRCSIVRSEAEGAAAHDGFRWEVKGTSFVRSEGFAPRTLILRDAIEEFEAEMPDEVRYEFTDALFGALDGMGIKTVSDLTEQKLRQGLQAVKELAKDPDVKLFVSEFIEQLIKNDAEYRISKVKNLTKLPFKKRKAEAGEE